MSGASVCGLAQSMGFTAGTYYLKKDGYTEEGYYVYVQDKFTTADGQTAYVGQGFYSKNNSFPMGNIQQELQKLRYVPKLSER